MRTHSLRACFFLKVYYKNCVFNRMLVVTVWQTLAIFCLSFSLMAAHNMSLFWLNSCTYSVSTYESPHLESVTSQLIFMSVLTECLLRFNSNSVPSHDPPPPDDDDGNLEEKFDDFQHREEADAG